MNNNITLLVGITITSKDLDNKTILLFKSLNEYIPILIKKFYEFSFKT